MENEKKEKIEKKEKEDLKIKINLMKRMKN